MRKRHKRQNKKFIFAVLILLVLLLVAYTYAIKNPAIIEEIPKATGKYPEPKATPVITATTPDSTIKVAAFNIQVFGTTKAGNPEVIETLSKIIRNYDIIAIQEIRGASQTALPALESAVNAMGGPQYDSIVSERLGRTTSKEQYAYLYNMQTVQLVGTPYTYPDPSDIFHREPYIAEFKAKNGNFDFVLITIHTDPDEATQEINDLPRVVDDAKGRFQGEDDFIVMGDLNADCSYFKEDSQSPLKSMNYFWVINNSVDTTTKSTDCTYDRIIITTSTKEDFTGDSGVFRFDTAYNLMPEKAAAVSDHYPVYTTFWSNRDTD